MKKDYRKQRKQWQREEKGTKKKLQQQRKSYAFKPEIKQRKKEYYNKDKKNQMILQLEMDKKRRKEEALPHFLG